MRLWPRAVRVALGVAIQSLQLGVTLGMPGSRPMPSIGPAVEELRLKDASGQYRVFYLARHVMGVLIFHAFVKKTRATPQHEIKLARSRLKELT